MAWRKFGNLWASTLTAGINDSVLSLAVASDSGAPAVPFDARIVAEGANTDEIIRVTVDSSGTFTIVRATEKIGNGTQVASAHASGATIEAVLTAGGVNEIINRPSRVAKVYAYGTFQ